MTTDDTQPIPRLGGHQSLRVSQFINDDTTVTTHVQPTGEYSWLNFSNTATEEVTVFGDRDTLRRVVTDLYDQFHAAEAVMDADELGRMDAEQDRAELLDAVTEDLDTWAPRGLGPMLDKDDPSQYDPRGV